MGSGITVDKRTTSLPDWFEAQKHLQSIEFQGEIENHIVMWKLLPEDNSSQIICIPSNIDIYSAHSLFAPQQAYIILAIKSNAEAISRDTPPPLSIVLTSIQQNNQQSSTVTPVANGQFRSVQYAIYAYFGKLSTNKVRLMALSYALKLHQTLSYSQGNQKSLQKKLTILSSGGYIKNKKLQKGSTVELCRQQSFVNRDLFNFQKIAVLGFFIQPVRKKLAIFNYKPKAEIPIIRRPASEYSQNSQSNANINLPKIPGLKPPMLKLTLKPYEEVTYDQISDQQKNGIKFDIRATARHELKMQKFQKQCNEIIEGLFLSGQKAARDIETLRKYNITEIVNCAGDYCQNWHEDKGVNYLTLFIKDSQNESIECLFYRVIEFIQNAQKNKKNVLIHCIQGISRSVTFCIAYIIFTHGLDYKKAESLVKSKRGIACPNNGFMVELIQFHKRLYEDAGTLPLPRVFLVSAHSKETPSIITARMLKQALFDPRRYLGLDARAVYIIQTASMIYLWVGSKCDEGRLQKYWTYAQDYIKKLQKYERAPQQVKGISQGSEGPQFFGIWGLEQIPPLYQNEEYNRLFHQGERAKPGCLRKYYERQQQKQVLKRLFIYPDSENGLGVFELDDLTGLSILCSCEDSNLKVYICRDQQYSLTQEEESKFLDKVIKDHYSAYDPEKINVSQENTPDYSEGFLASFS